MVILVCHGIISIDKRDKGVDIISFIHSNLKVLAAEKGLNIQKIKDKTSLSRTTISNLFNDIGAGIQYETLIQLCELLECNPGDILSYIEASVEILEDHVEYEEKKDQAGKLESLLIRLKANCKIVYEKDVTEFPFEEEVKVNFEKKGKFKLSFLEQSTFSKSLERIRIPYYVKDYIERERDSYYRKLVESKDLDFNHFK